MREDGTDRDISGLLDIYYHHLTKTIRQAMSMQ